MKWRSFLLFLTLLSCHFPIQADIWENITHYFKGKNRPEPPEIRVLVLHDVEGANLQIHGKYSLYDPYTNSHISSRFAGKNRYIQASGDGLKWGESFPGLYQIKIEPDNNLTLTMINGQPYEGVIYVYDIGGTISIVNQIPVEDYIRSILANDENDKLEPETLAALAIVLRTNAYFQAANPKNTYWAVDAQKIGFQGNMMGFEAIDRAVDVTRYMVMSRTGIYEGVATPFAAQFPELVKDSSLQKGVELSKISLEEANALAKKGEHAAQILGKAFPGSTLMMMQYSR